MTAVCTLPVLTACGAAQMAVDEGLLADARFVTARRYLWSPPALSLGRFQKLAGEAASGGGATAAAAAAADGRAADLPFDVVRRPSGGRAVLHGAGFEWSFSVAFPAGSLPSRRVDDAYAVVSEALAAALAEAGVRLDDGRRIPYRRSALCFATSLRHDLLAGAGKLAAVAQLRRGGAALVHGSVLERRPPADLVAAVERCVGEAWRGDGVAATGVAVAADRVWSCFLDGLGARLATCARGRGGRTSPMHSDQRGSA